MTASRFGLLILHPDRVAAAWLRSGVPLLKPNPERPTIKSHSLPKAALSFIIERDGRFLAAVPEQGKSPFGRPIFQNLQYSDTPTQPHVPLRFVDANADLGSKHTYCVIAVNTVGLKSAPCVGLPTEARE